MEKINLVEILKDCPKGMELDCTMFDTKVFYQGLSERTPTHPIVVQTEHGFEYELTQYGQIYNIVGSKCVIFPKGKTTWERFIPICKFKDGDIIFKQNFIAIISYIEPNGRIWYHCWYNTKYRECRVKTDFGIGCINDGIEIRFATEEEKQKLFQTIKDKGYKWNEKTKTLEKLVKPKFKVGDRIRHKIVNFIHVITGIKDEYYIMDEVSFPHGILPIEAQNEYELVPDKFDFTTLKPFDKVLVRDSNFGRWKIQLFEKYDKTCKFPFICMGYNKYKQCVPYSGNEYLYDTINPCSDYYQI